jgi:hypothetical protein
MRRTLSILVVACTVVTAAAAASRPLAPVRFQKAPGWYVGASRVHTCPGAPRCSQVASWAATVRWRDCYDCEPPHKTLASLPAGGIVIGVLLGKEPRPPRHVMSWPPRLRAGAIGGPIEGAPARIGYFGQGGRLRGFSASLFVYFGRLHPTKHQIARAQAELNSAKLP